MKFADAPVADDGASVVRDPSDAVRSIVDHSYVTIVGAVAAAAGVRIATNTIVGAMRLRPVAAAADATAADIHSVRS
jgi:hypothetical protein